MILIVCVVMSCATAFSIHLGGDESVYFCAYFLSISCGVSLLCVAYRIAKLIKKFTGKK